MLMSGFCSVQLRYIWGNAVCCVMVCSAFVRLGELNLKFGFVRSCCLMDRYAVRCFVMICLGLYFLVMVGVVLRCEFGSRVFRFRFLLLGMMTSGALCVCVC